MFPMFATATKIRYFTKAGLIEANKEAIKTRRNRTLHPHLLEALPDLRFPVGFTMIHNDHEMRVQIAVGPDVATLDGLVEGRTAIVVGGLHAGACPSHKVARHRHVTFSCGHVEGCQAPIVRTMHVGALLLH